MFGINSFNQVGQIVIGHFKEITNKENELYEKRIKICKTCPLYTNSSLGPICDSKKCWNDKINSLELLPNKNNKCGCGCRLNAKTRLVEAECVLNKW